ncbi:hypothetical protein PUN28_002608 [Cardiocondyla obscurior]|uniref:Uncharacterized protein n=1 Tax=Cardiocondyla obscurior TaxID=286306 RepID=A0AAW2GV99_9HYME
MRLYPPYPMAPPFSTRTMPLGFVPVEPIAGCRAACRRKIAQSRDGKRTARRWHPATDEIVVVRVGLHAHVYTNHVQRAANRSSVCRCDCAVAICSTMERSTLALI